MRTSFFASETNTAIIEKLKQYGLQLEISAEKLAQQSDKLKGLSIVVSGVFETVSRTELKKLIEDNGGKVASSISSVDDSRVNLIFYFIKLAFWQGFKKWK